MENQPFDFVKDLDKRANEIFLVVLSLLKAPQRPTNGTNEVPDKQKADLPEKLENFDLLCDEIYRRIEFNKQQYILSHAQEIGSDEETTKKILQIITTVGPLP
eukprot:TRINITY_DN3611_c0_g1_i5.p2 TRINITY_DN3611_c0_g1~~TRINITY_DN3611_c0_g1_i5.p2  ORF type:complete len:103 (-),score=19.27 TRINITY_DN3611_c0_g1_i5:483-791(-)